MSAFYLRIAGIGGQGSVHLAKTLAQAAVACGTTVRHVRASPLCHASRSHHL